MSARRIRFRAGGYLFEQGSPSRHAYRLISGRGEILRNTPREDGRVAVINPGDFMGEMGLLIATPRNASARFMKDSEVEEYSRSDFLRLIRAEKELALRLLHALSLRTRAQIELLSRVPADVTRAKENWQEKLNRYLRTRLRSFPLSQKAAADLASAAYERIPVEKGDLIFREGDLSESVYWVESGRIRVERREPVGVPHVGHVERHEFLGEMGILESVPRSADAIAERKGVLKAIPAGEFLRLLEHSPAIYFFVVETLCERARRMHYLNSDIQRLASRPDSKEADLFVTASSIDSMAQLAQQRLLSEANRMKRFFSTQKERGGFVSGAYQRYLKGTATAEEMERANAYLRDYLKMVGVSALFLLPGGVVTVPLAAKIGKAIGVDIFPAAEAGDEALGN